jgi:hypothetical protein
MTRTKLSRLRRAYNRTRRVNRGWRPTSWDCLLDSFVDVPDSEFRFWMVAHYGLS